MSVSVPAGVVDPASVTFMAGNATVQTFTNLTQQEQAKFDQGLKRLATSDELWQREAAELWSEDRDTYLWGASIAKNQLGDIPFDGLLANAAGTFGMVPIRAPYIVSGNPQSWLVNQGTLGWNSKVWNVNLSSTGTTSGSVTNTQNRVILIAPRIANYALTPKVNAIRWTVGPTQYPVQVNDWMKLSNMSISKNLGALFVGKNGTFTSDFLVESTGTDGTALWGLAFATGDWMTLET